MNRAYKLVWNTVSASWVVASELAKGRKKSSSTALKLAVLVAAGIGAGMANAAPAANALPSGESIASGSATFDRTVSNQLTVNQSSSKLITNWNSFDVGSGATVQFAQPDASSIALNRVTSGSASEIFGQVTANGQLVIVNPNGVTFGAGSQVSAASIIGSVLDINDSDFNAGTLLFSRGSATGTIDNQGSLTGTAGSVSLLAPTVKNSGTITATGGNAALINADAVNLTAADPSVTTASSITGLIQQSGSISATHVSSVGGKILLTGDTSQSTSQIQLAGALQADTTSVNGRSIVVNGDVNLNGASNVLDLTSTDGYSLTNGAALNLNGASSGFSVNGTAYTVIRDVDQLQAMSSNLAGRYVLASNIDASATSGWNSGAGFVPIAGNGDLNSRFSGVLDGLGHTVNALSIIKPGNVSGIGLIGVASSTTIQNIGLTNVNFQAGWIAAPLVGGVLGGTTTIKNVYVTGTFNVPAGSTGYMGSLVGSVTGTGGGNINISNSYSTLNINATTVVGGYIGGLVGTISAGTNSITDSYFAGSINSQTSRIGGIYAGNLSAPTSVSLNRVYVSGALSGTSNVGGLVGSAPATLTVTNSYWNTETTGRASAFGGGTGVLTNVTGLTTAQSKLLSSYANWGSSIDAQAGTGTTWRIYDGQSGPLLRSFLKPLNVANNSKTYDATAYTGTLASGIDLSKVLGTANYTGAAIGAVNAGTYAQNVSGLYSVQNGYDIFTDGTFTIDKASLSISSTDANKVYDGTTAASASAVISSGSLFGSDSISGGTFAFADKHAGSGKTVMVSGVSVNDGNKGENYEVSYVDNTSSTIKKRLLTISAVVDSKEYDGKLTSSATAKPVVVGRQRGDSIVGLTQSYLDKNAGTGKTINVDSGYTIRDGNNGNNYDVVVVNTTSGVITPKALTISTVANSKVYDGGITSANKPLVTGLLTGDRITGLFQQYETKTVGENKKLLIKNGYVVQDGNSGGNYSVTEQGSMDGVITAH
jgi:filamentous hemagglutinin family protein